MIARNVELADRIIPALGFTRPGPVLTGAELVCLAVAQVLLPTCRRPGAPSRSNALLSAAQPSPSVHLGALSPVAQLLVPVHRPALRRQVEQIPQRTGSLPDRCRLGYRNGSQGILYEERQVL